MQLDVLPTLPALADLNLCACALLHLPPGVAACTGLRSLNLPLNLMEGIPQGPYLSGLERLDVSQTS